MGVTMDGCACMGVTMDVFVWMCLYGCGHGCACMGVAMDVFVWMCLYGCGHGCACMGVTMYVFVWVCLYGFDHGCIRRSARSLLSMERTSGTWSMDSLMDCARGQSL